MILDYSGGGPVITGVTQFPEWNFPTQPLDPDQVGQVVCTLTGSSDTTTALPGNVDGGCCSSE